MAGREVRALNTATAKEVTDSGTTEKVILTLSGVDTESAGSTVMIIGFLEATIGLGGTAYTIKCHRGTTKEGTQVGTTYTETVTAEKKSVIPFVFIDTPGEIAEGHYVITVTGTGNTGNGTVDLASAVGYQS